ncbi:hypothetical protein J6590_038427 [Homalodisca vitripennis]|nr:hypothetical protein J6590_038427 [Homalodisca vitripennis]
MIMNDNYVCITPRSVVVPVLFAVPFGGLEVWRCSRTVHIPSPRVQVADGKLRGKYVQAREFRKADHSSASLAPNLPSTICFEGRM